MNAHGDSLCQDDSEVLLVDYAIDQIGTGMAQRKLFLITGLFLAADAAEVSYLSYVTITLKHDWRMSAWSESLITSMVFAGQIVGSPVWGLLADKYGRRPSCLMSSFVVALFGLLTACCQDVASLVSVRALVGFGVSGLSVPYDLLAEALPKKTRGWWLMAIMFFQPVGALYTTFIAWLVLHRHGWQLFTAICSIPAILGAMLGYLLLPESAHWLATERRCEEAGRVVTKMATDNNVNSIYKTLKTPQPLEPVGTRDLLLKKHVRRPFFLMAIVWFGFGMSFYGIFFMVPHLFASDMHEPALANTVTLGDRGCTSDDQHRNNAPTFDFADIAITDSALALGLLIGIMAINTIGRKQIQIAGYGIVGFASIFVGFKQLGFGVLTFITSLASCAGMAASCATWVHTPELFPTKVRSTAHALLNAISRIGGFTAPFIVCDVVSAPVMAQILSAVSFAAALSVCGLCETADQERGY